MSCVAASQAQQASAMVTVPSGTVVPLTLVNPIKNKSTKPGDTIRASVAFPITVGDQVAIPAGTYVEGILGQPLPKVKHQPGPGVQIHFTRLVFANGYSAPLDATQASALPGLPSLPPSPSLAQPATMALMAGLNSFNLASTLTSLALPGLCSLASGWRSWLMAPQAVPPSTVPPLPHVGPSTGILVGIGVGAPAAVIILGILFHHKAANSDFIVHDAGWQFQMKLDAPLSVDPSQIATKTPSNKTDSRLFPQNSRLTPYESDRRPRLRRTG
jgi:type IV secretion system protein VirB10